MNLSIFVIIAGALILFIPGGMWVGFGLLAIGMLLEQMSRKEPMAFARAPPKFMQVMEQSPQKKATTGVNWNTTTPFNQQKNQPGIQNGMFNLPLPIDEQISQFVDMSYKTPTSANTLIQEKKKGGNPFLPEF